LLDQYGSAETVGHLPAWIREAGGAAGPKGSRSIERDEPHAGEHLRKFNPAEPRNPHTGEWIDTTPGDGLAGTVKDVLNLAGRIDLAPGEQFMGSAKVDVGDDLTAVLARVDGPSGARLRFGLVAAEETGRWRAANRGGTVELDEHGVGDLRKVVADAPRLGKASVAEFNKQPDSPTTADVASGTVRGARWGDIAWQLYRDETPDGGSRWELALDVQADIAQTPQDQFFLGSTAQVKKLSTALNGLFPTA
jgi:hypothetical protein